MYGYTIDYQAFTRITPWLAALPFDVYATAIFLAFCKRLSFALQKVTSYMIKGYLLQGEKPSFVNRHV